MFICLAAAVLDCVICCCGAVMWSVWADWVIDRGDGSVSECVSKWLLVESASLTVLLV